MHLDLYLHIYADVNERCGIGRCYAAVNIADNLRDSKLNVRSEVWKKLDMAFMLNLIREL